MLRRDLLRLRNAADAAGRGLPAADSAELPQIRPAMHPLFRDVTDHIRTVQEKIDNLREVLAFAFEASLLVGQSQETAIAKKLAAWAAILAVPTAVAGIYGMNFQDMPELKCASAIRGGAGWHRGDLLGPLLALPQERLAVGAGSATTFAGAVSRLSPPSGAR